MNTPYKTPKSKLLIESSIKKPHVLWTFLFWAHVLMFPFIIGVLFFVNLSLQDYLDLLIFPIILAGLYGFVFSKRVIHQMFWKVFCFLYPLWFIYFEFISPIILKVPQFGEPVVVDEFLLLAPAFGIPTFIFLYLYSFRSETLWKHSC